MSKLVVAGMWERGYDAPLTEYQKWFHMIREFGVDEWYMRPISGIVPSEGAKPPLTELQTVEEIIEKNKDCVPIVLDEKGTESLPDFVHPENALYICGIAGVSFMNDKTRSLCIPTVRESGGLWSHQALSIILYDRMIKCGNSNN